MEDKNMNDLEWLADWYMSNCNGKWEEYYGIKIQTIDNPGWLVEIDILETVLENLPFATINIDNSDEDWMNCKVENGKYIGVGDQTKLAEIIKIFKRWSEHKIISHLNYDA